MRFKIGGKKFGHVPGTSLTPRELEIARARQADPGGANRAAPAESSGAAMAGESAPHHLPRRSSSQSKSLSPRGATPTGDSSKVTQVEAVAPPVLQTPSVAKMRGPDFRKPTDQYSAVLAETDHLESLLDFGCGGGRDIDHTFGKFPDCYVLGIDHDPEAAPALEDVRQKLDESGRGKLDLYIGRSIRQAVKDLKLDDVQFGMVNAQFSLPFILEDEELSDCLKSMHEKLKPGGRLVGNFFGDQHSWLITKDPLRSKDRRYYKKEEVEQFLIDAGFLTGC